MEWMIDFCDGSVTVWVQCTLTLVCPLVPTHVIALADPYCQFCLLLDLSFWHCPSLSHEYSAPGRGAEYCDEHVCVSVCVYVCLSVRDRIFRTTGTRTIFTNFFVRVSYGHGSVLWRRSDTLYTSSFIDDVLFAHKPRLLDVGAQLKCSAHEALGLAVYAQ